MRANEVLEGEYVELPLGSSGWDAEPDEYVGGDDFATVGGAVERTANPHRSHLERAAQPGVSMAAVGFMAAGASLGYSLGRSTGARIALAGAGAAVAVALYEAGRRRTAGGDA